MIAEWEKELENPFFVPGQCAAAASGRHNFLCCLECTVQHIECGCSRPYKECVQWACVDPKYRMHQVVGEDEALCLAKIPSSDSKKKKP